MSVDIIVPFQGDDPERLRAFDYVMDRLRTDHPACRVIPGILGRQEPWSKGRAVSAALTRSYADILVVHDADVWTTGLGYAIDKVRAGRTWAIPHGQVRRLTPESTRAFMADQIEDLQLKQPAYRGVAGGGIVVIQRDAYLRTPFDPRFTGWGQEDESFAIAARCVHRSESRGRAPLWHLWHPPAPRMDRRFGSLASRALHQRYRLAAHSPSKILAIIDEIRSPVSAPPDQHGDPA